MNKHDLTVRLARESHRSRAKAADALDTLVYELLKDLKDPSAEAAAKIVKPAPASSADNPKEKP